MRTISYESLDGSTRFLATSMIRHRFDGSNSQYVHLTVFLLKTRALGQEAPLGSNQRSLVSTEIHRISATISDVKQQKTRKTLQIEGKRKIQKNSLEHSILFIEQNVIWNSFFYIFILI